LITIGLHFVVFNNPGEYVPLSGFILSLVLLFLLLLTDFYNFFNKGSIKNGEE
jgi:hypothetical protein